MIDSEHILTIGPEYQPPKGGIAQCVSLYDKLIFRDFRYIANSCDGSPITKLLKALSSVLHCCYLLLTDRNIRIVHIHTASNNSFRRSTVILRIARIFRKRVVMHIHGGGFKTYFYSHESSVRRRLSECDAIITLSPVWQQFIRSVTGHDNVYVVHNIIDLPVKNKMCKDGLFHLLFLGHISKNKGVFDLLDLLNEYHDTYRGELVLDIAGGLYDVRHLEQYIDDSNLGDVVRFHGWVSGTAKQNLLNLADAFILPSYIEGVPISILEAMSYGLPILSTTVGGIPEIVSDGVNGFLFSPGDKTSIKSSIDTLLNDTGLCQRMGAASLQMCSSNMPAMVESELTQIYADL